MKPHVKSGAMMTPREIALGYLDAFSSGDPAQVASYVSADFENKQMTALGENCTGRLAYQEKLKDFLSDFQKLCYTPEQIIEQGNHVAVAYHMQAEEKGKPITIHGVMMMTISDGLIQRRSDYWDGLSYLRQGGQAP